MSSAQLYDTIGAVYTVTRSTEPRIAAQVWAALGDARTVLNVGAGTGSYEPPGRDVTAVEPSAVMWSQRPEGAAPCMAAIAESLPFQDQSFGAAMAFKSICGSWPAVAATCVVGARGWLAEQDHPAYIPCRFCPLNPQIKRRAHPCRSPSEPIRFVGPAVAAGRH